MDQNLSNILEKEEKISWQDKINRKVITFNTIVFWLIFGTMAIYTFSQPIINYGENNANAVPGSWVGAGVLVLGALITIFALWSQLVKEYTVTNKRIIIKSGLIGTDYKSIYFTEIKTLLVDVGIVGKIFGTGTVKIDTGKIDISSSTDSKGHSSTKSRIAYDTLNNINKPYDIYKIIQTSLTGRQESLYSGRADKENSLEK